MKRKRRITKLAPGWVSTSGVVVFARGSGGGLLESGSLIDGHRGRVVRVCWVPFNEHNVGGRAESLGSRHLGKKKKKRKNQLKSIKIN